MNGSVARVFEVGKVADLKRVGDWFCMRMEIVLL